MLKRRAARVDAGASTYLKVGLADWLMLKRRSFTLRRTDMLCYLLTSSRSVLEYIAICLRTVQSVLKTKWARAHRQLCSIVVLCIVVLCGRVCVILWYRVVWYCGNTAVWYSQQCGIAMVLLYCQMIVLRYSFCISVVLQYYWKNRVFLYCGTVL